MIEKETLIREYVKALRNNNASVFVGSGISSPIFNKCWKELILPYAIKIGLSNDTMGDDYPFIAQSYINCGNDELAFQKEIQAMENLLCPFIFCCAPGSATGWR